MIHDSAAADPDDRPLMPPDEISRGVGPLRWVITGVALVLLIVGAWRAYQWFVADVERRRAVATGAAPNPHAPAPSEADPLSEGMPPAVGEPPAPASTAPRNRATRQAEPPAPAVTGVAGVNKCVVDGQVTYTNAPCPPSAQEEPEPVLGTDPNGVTGSAGDAPVAAAPPAPLRISGHDPSQRQAACQYLVAEIQRLSFEFEQPLPPPVIDHISTRLSDLRAQHESAGCEPLREKAAAKAKSERSNTPVTTERRRRGEDDGG